ncbi:hypothetical protein ACWEO2_31800 [Nocardia sp. NPDC004278]|uniref:hypothetical protein n=1 Tax=Nocardia sp. NPDC004604 TaxID=3157013 RepID=UPI0033A9C55D
MTATDLGGGRTYALQYVHEIDGRISWFAEDVRGFAPSNNYLVRTDAGSLLIDTGLAADRQDVLADIAALVSADEELSVLLLRMSEFDSTQNLVEIEDLHTISRIYSTFEDAPMWGAYSTEDEVLNAHHRARLHRIGVNMIRGVEYIELGGRRLKLIRPLLRLLPTYWVYDEDARMLYTSDSFGHVVSGGTDGALEVDPDADPTTVEDVLRHLVGTRYWWLPTAATSLIRDDVRRIFAEHDVHTIAPARGGLIRGKEAVDRHVVLLDEALAGLGHADAEVLAAANRRSW